MLPYEMMSKVIVYKSCYPAGQSVIGERCSMPAASGAAQVRERDPPCNTRVMHACNTRVMHACNTRWMHAAAMSASKPPAASKTPAARKPGRKLLNVQWEEMLLAPKPKTHPRRRARWHQAPKHAKLSSP